MKTIAFINQKGGVGKTTSTINIGAALWRAGKKVMLIDLDPQANLTYSLGIKAHELEFTIYDLLKNEIDLESVLISRDGMKVLPSTLDLSGAEIELSGTPGREFLLKEALNGLKGFDYMLIDCPPSLGLLTINALTTAKELFIPLQAEYLALQGMKKLLETVELVKKRLNKDLELSGIICTLYDSRKNLNREVEAKVREHFGEKVFKTVIRDNISLAEAPSFGKTIFEYKPNSKGAEDYINLTKEITNRGKK